MKMLKCVGSYAERIRVTMYRKAEEMRIRYLYRDMILRGKIKLPYEAAVKLVGPDCAYHLYSVGQLDSEKDQKQGRMRELDRS